jgi:hypothetical protein
MKGGLIVACSRTAIILDQNAAELWEDNFFAAE